MNNEKEMLTEEIAERIKNVIPTRPTRAQAKETLEELFGDMEIFSARCEFKCDETTNTEETINKGEMRATIKVPALIHTFECTVRERKHRVFKLSGKNRKQKKRMRRKLHYWNWCRHEARYGKPLYLAEYEPMGLIPFKGVPGIVGTSKYGSTDNNAP